MPCRMFRDIDEAERMDELIDDFLAFVRRRDHGRVLSALDGRSPLVPRPPWMFLLVAGPPPGRRRTCGRIDDLRSTPATSSLPALCSPGTGVGRIGKADPPLSVRTTMLVRDRRFTARPRQERQHPPGAGSSPEAKPWKSRAFAADELPRFWGRHRGIHWRLDFQPVEFQQRSRARRRALPRSSRASGRAATTFFIFIKAPAANWWITGGIPLRDQGNVRVELWKIGGAAGRCETLAGKWRVARRGGRTVKHRSLPGLYKLVVRVGRHRSRGPPGSG